MTTKTWFVISVNFFIDILVDKVIIYTIEGKGVLSVRSLCSTIEKYNFLDTNLFLYVNQNTSERG